MRYQADKVVGDVHAPVGREKNLCLPGGMHRIFLRGQSVPAP